VRWFLPEGVPRPDHLPPSAQVGAVSVIAGPSGGPGHIIGGVYLLGEPGWVELPAGWWINAVGSSPSRLLRLDARDGVEIPGADGHRWLVPNLFRPLAGGLVWAGEQRLGPMGWSVPPPPEPWRSVGLAIRDRIQAGGWDQLEDEDVTALALPLLCSNYYLLPCELIAAEWLIRSMLPATFAATIGAE
jgi:hypothetical protein